MASPSVRAGTSLRSRPSFRIPDRLQAINKRGRINSLYSPFTYSARKIFRRYVPVKTIRVLLAKPAVRCRSFLPTCSPERQTYRPLRRVVARCGVVVNEDSSVNFNRGTAGFPVGILNVDDRIPTVDGIALRFEYTAINLQVSFLRGACRCYQNTRVGNSGSIRTDGEVSVLDRRSALRNTDRCIGPFAAAAAVNGNGAVDNQIGGNRYRCLQRLWLYCFSVRR